MHDPLDQQRMKDDAALAAALRALPPAAPPDEGWQRLATRLARRRRARTALGIAVPAALAAGVAIAVMLPQWWPAQVPPPPSRVAQRSAPAAAHATNADVGALRAQSQRLQAWVSTLDRNGAPMGSDALASAVALQDRIGLIDLQLSAATDPATRASLWQERNLLLQQLGLLHLQPYSVAEHTRSTPNQTTIL